MSDESGVAAIARQMEYDSRLEFLYKAVEDTQNTIRFIDTKAAFCVTLLSGMAAAVLQGHHAVGTAFERAGFAAFILAVVLSLLVCLRVIFPVIKPHSDYTPHTTRTIPKFFVSHAASHQWLRHTLGDDVEDVLSETRSSYTAAMSGASDDDLLMAMCDELLMVSLIRQMKSDRLHTAIYLLIVSIAIFAAVMLG